MSEGLLEIEGHLCFKEKSVVEPIEGVAARWSQDFELHKILQIFGRNSQNRASLLEFQFDTLHAHIPSTVQMLFESSSMTVSVHGQGLICVIALSSFAIPAFRFAGSLVAKPALVNPCRCL